MNEFHQLISRLIIDTKGLGGGALAFAPDSSIAAFRPELILCGTIVLMLLVRVFKFGQRIDAFYIAFLGTLAALLSGLPLNHLGAEAINYADPSAVTRMEIFTGMLVYDTFTVFMRALLLLFVVLFLVFTKLSGIPDKEDGPDIYTLVLGSTLGMCLMASANHLLTIFLAVEMASVPSYVLAGMLKGRRRGSEAALKYSIYGAGAAGVMLYGISLLAGIAGSAHLPTLAGQLGGKLIEGMPPQELMVLALGGLMVMVGLAFKLSAVPFHFWCPDVFEGAAAEVNAFLSVASKAAALALLVRVVIGVGFLGPQPIGFEDIPPGTTLADYKLPGGEHYFAPGLRSAVQSQTSGANDTETTTSSRPLEGQPGLMAVEDELENSVGVDGGEAGDVQVGGDTFARGALVTALEPVRGFLGKLVAFLAVITCTFGNLAAYGQTNIKRLLAYSTIAHAGYMMMAVPPVMAMAGLDPAAAQSAVAALAIYLGVYLFMNLGAFAVVAFLRNAMGSEEISDYAGLLRQTPGVTICFSIILFSLVGLPPLAGFIGKFAIFASLVDGYQITAAAGQPAGYLMVVLVAGGLNTAVSLFYYLRVVKVMTMDPDPADRRPFSFSDVSLQGLFVWFTAAATVLLFFYWNGLKDVAEAAARHLLT
ncbi:MAG: NADH-quinone oxidoreductase subunit N [Pirellulaceae bacterium]